MTSRDAVIAEARALLGVRFAHQGRHPAYGLDCLGLLLIVAARTGLLPADSGAEAVRADYSSRPDGAYLMGRLDHWLVRQERARPGDVLLLDIHGEPQHLALATDYPTPGALGMIHAYAPARKVVEHRYDATWQQATRAIYGWGD